jgi:sugar phosphate isomerase/epimerase
MRARTRRDFLRDATAGLGAAVGMASTTVAAAGSEAKGPFSPRLAICNETFRDWPFPKAFAFAAQCGYQGVEIAPFTISDYVTDVPPKRRQAIRRQAEQAGLEVVGLHWLLARTKGLHLTSPEAETRLKTTEYLGALADFCADLGGKLLVFGSPKQRNVLPGVSQADAMRHAADVIQGALPRLEATDVTLALEPLSPGTTNFVSTAAEAVALIDRVGSPRCRLILDCNAMSTESKPIPELIRRHRARLAHFHANDPNRQGPGFGSLDFVPIFEALREIDYRGWISVEVFDYRPGPERLARESIQYMQKCLARSGSSSA